MFYVELFIKFFMYDIIDLIISYLFSSYNQLYIVMYIYEPVLMLSLSYFTTIRRRMNICSILNSLQSGYKFTYNFIKNFYNL